MKSLFHQFSHRRTSLFRQWHRHSTFERWNSGNVKISQPTNRPLTRSKEKEVFCNGDLRLDRIEVVGFDYDYTLAEYTPELQHLIYESAIYACTVA